MPLTWLNLDYCSQIADLPVLRGMKLTWLNLGACGQVRDLTFLKGMPLGLLRGGAPPAISLVFDQLAAELEHKLELTAPEQSDEYVSLVV